MGLLLKRALDMAAIWHKGQKRKYPQVEVPYVSHLAGVVAILARHGFAATRRARNFGFNRTRMTFLARPMG